MPAITPIDEIRHRIAEIGRIRTGYSVERKKRSKEGTWMAPVKSDTWVLTSTRPDILAVLAERYGGQVDEWDDDRTQHTHRVITTTPVGEPLEVVLPPEPLGDPAYEMWESGSIRRRCNGVTVLGWPRDGSPPFEKDCICKGVDDPAKQCKPTTHLSLMFPESPVGVWRLTTRSYNAMAELRSSVEVIKAASMVGLPRAHLRVEIRRKPGKEYPVPVLTSMSTLAELEDAALNGAAGRLESGAPPARMALPAGAEVIDLEDGDSWEEPADG